MEKLFVYGSLRKNAPFSQSQKFKLEYFEPAYAGGALYDFGSWPGAVFDGTGVIGGEIVGVDAKLLRRLDKYESVESGLFERVKINVSTEDSSTHEVWAYQISNLTVREYNPQRVKSGSWIDDEMDFESGNCPA